MGETELGGSVNGRKGRRAEGDTEEKATGVTRSRVALSLTQRLATLVPWLVPRSWPRFASEPRLSTLYLGPSNEMMLANGLLVR